MRRAKRVVAAVLVPMFLSALCPEFASASATPTWAFQAENGYVISIIDRSATDQLQEWETAHFSATVVSPNAEELSLDVSVKDEQGHLSLKTTVDSAMSMEFSGVQLADGSYDLSTLSLSIPGAKTAITVELPILALQNQQQITKAQEAALLTMFDGIRGSRSSSFNTGAVAALQEMTTVGPPSTEIFNQIFGCILGVIGYIGSILGLATCVAVWPCVIAIGFHYVAIAAAVDACVR